MPGKIPVSAIPAEELTAQSGIDNLQGCVHPDKTYSITDWKEVYWRARDRKVDKSWANWCGDLFGL